MKITDKIKGFIDKTWVCYLKRTKVSLEKNTSTSWANTSVT
jgi:hypothetical protein